MFIHLHPLRLVGDFFLEFLEGFKKSKFIENIEN